MHGPCTNTKSKCIHNTLSCFFLNRGLWDSYGPLILSMRGRVTWRERREAGGNGNTRHDHQTGATSGAAHWARSVKAAAGPAVRPREDDVESPKAASIDALMFCHVHVPDNIVCFLLPSSFPA